MIIAYTGKPGGGKSLHATQEGLLALKRRGGTVANFAITGKPSTKWWFMDERELRPDLMRHHGLELCRVGRESEALLIIDEAHRLFDSRSGWQSQSAAKDGKLAPGGRADWIDFLREHRHYGFDVILVAQELRSLDKQVRALVEVEVRHLKLNSLWWFSWVPVPIFVKTQFLLSFNAGRGHVSISMGLGPWLTFGMGRYDHQAMRGRSLLLSAGGAAGVGAPAARAPWRGVPVPPSSWARLLMRVGLRAARPGRGELAPAPVLGEGGSRGGFGGPPPS